MAQQQQQQKPLCTCIYMREMQKCGLVNSCGMAAEKIGHKFLPQVRCNDCARQFQAFTQTKLAFLCFLLHYLNMYPSQSSDKPLSWQGEKRSDSAIHFSLRSSSNGAADCFMGTYAWERGIRSWPSGIHLIFTTKSPPLIFHTFKWVFFFLPPQCCKGGENNWGARSAADEISISRRDNKHKDLLRSPRGPNCTANSFPKAQIIMQRQQNRFPKLPPSLSPDFTSQCWSEIWDHEKVLFRCSSSSSTSCLCPRWRILKWTEHMMAWRRRRHSFSPCSSSSNFCRTVIGRRRQSSWTIRFH